MSVTSPPPCCPVNARHASPHTTPHYTRCVSGRDVLDSLLPASESLQHCCRQLQTPDLQHVIVARGLEQPQRPPDNLQRAEVIGHAAQANCEVERDVDAICDANTRRSEGACGRVTDCMTGVWGSCRVRVGCEGVREQRTNKNRTGAGAGAGAATRMRTSRQ
jgi:hypothetical protein